MAGIPNLKEVIQEIRNTVSLEEYARYLGYVPDPSEGKGKTISYYKPGTGRRGEGDKVIIQVGRNSKTGQDLYFNRKGYPEDQGDIVQFAKNRLSGELSLRTSPQDTLEAVERLMAFRGLEIKKPELKSTKGKEKEGVKILREVGSEKAVFRLEDYVLDPVLDTRYLESRKIPLSAIQSPQFQNRIFSGNSKKILEDYPDLKNTVFPLYRFQDTQEKVVGMVLRNTPVGNYVGKILAAGSDHESGVWFSHIPEGCKRVIITESELDALSYCALHPEECKKAVFISTSGSLGNGQYSTIDDILGLVEKANRDAKKSAQEILLINDNDRQGCLQDLKLLTHWVNSGRFFTVKDWNLEYQVEKGVLKEDSLRISITPQSLQNKIKQLGDLMTLAKTFKKQVLKREIAVQTSDTKGFKTSFRFPLESDVEPIKAFIQALIPLLGFKGRIRIHKSMGKDWNEDLVSGVNRDIFQEQVSNTKGKKKTQKEGFSLRMENKDEIK